jgi:ATP-dependent Zn protease
MNCRQKCSGKIKWILLGALFLFALAVAGSNIFKNQTAKKAITFDEAVSRVQTGKINEINITGDQINLLDSENVKYRADVSERQKIELLEKGSLLNVTINLDNEPSNPLLYLFQILFWLFFISPPVIVVLLLVIIKKLDAISSAK